MPDAIHTPAPAVGDAIQARRQGQAALDFVAQAFVELLDMQSHVAQLIGVAADAASLHAACCSAIAPLARSAARWRLNPSLHLPIEVICRL